MHTESICVQATESFFGGKLNSLTHSLAVLFRTLLLPPEIENKVNCTKCPRDKDVCDEETLRQETQRKTQ